MAFRRSFLVTIEHPRWPDDRVQDQDECENLEGVIQDGFGYQDDLVITVRVISDEV